MKDKLKRLIQEKIKESFVKGCQSQATDDQVLGLIIARYFEWDGLAILRTMYAALEDANFHTENRVIAEMIKKQNRLTKALKMAKWRIIKLSPDQGFDKSLGEIDGSLREKPLTEAEGYQI